MNKKSTVDFLNAARNFVSLLEDGEIAQNDFYKNSHKALSELYWAALGLENIEIIYSGIENNLTEIERYDIIKMNKNLISNLGENVFYWQVFDPTYIEGNEKSTKGWHATGKEPMQGCLVDDFADIYGDLKEELIKIDEIGTNEAIEDALWQMKFGFNHHWGNHCINAIRALHYLWHDGKMGS